jgi:hypothetical protein
MHLQTRSQNSTTEHSSLQNAMMLKYGKLSFDVNVQRSGMTTLHQTQNLG